MGSAQAQMFSGTTMDETVWSRRFEVPKRARGVTVERDGNAFALSDPNKGAILLTNRVGASILELADGSRNVQAICTVLAERFEGTDASQIYNQVLTFLAHSEKKGVVSLIRPAAELRILNNPPSPVSRRREAPFSPDSPMPEVLELDEAAPASLDASDSAAEENRKFHPDIYWYLTFRCNLACTHCSVLSSPHVDTSGDLKTDDCLRVVDQMAEMQVVLAMLSGGEPLIRPDALQIMRALGDRGIGVGVESNGIKVGEKGFLELAQHLQAKKLLSIGISLDGGTAETHEKLRGEGSFGRTLKGLRALRDNGIQFSMQCVLNKQNYHTIPNLYELAAELKPRALTWSPLNSSGRGGELIKRAGLGYADILQCLDTIEQYKSGFSGYTIVKIPPAMIPPRYMLKSFKGEDTGICASCKFPLLGVLPNGDITVCAVSRNDPSLYFGNVREVRLKNAWQKARMDLLRTRYVAADELQGICGDCVWKHSCKGMCRAKAYEDGGDMFSPYPVCQEAADSGMFPDVYRISKGANANATSAHVF